MLGWHAAGGLAFGAFEVSGSLLSVGELYQRHNVCVVCDEPIIGVEPFRWIDEEVLRGDNIKGRLGVDRYEDHYHVELKDELVRQYTLPGLEGILLSP